MTAPQTGGVYQYTADQGLAARARIDDPAVSNELTSEMAELDMVPGTSVTVAGFDDDRQLVLIEWTDRSGNPRLTSVAPQAFDERFTLTQEG